MFLAVVALVAGLLGGNVGGTGDAAFAHTFAGQGTDVRSVVPAPAPLPEPIDGPDPLKYAIDDFAAHTGADPAEVNVVLELSVTWPDGSLGCPQPDQMHLPVQVYGYLIVLHADDEVGTYHGAAGELPFRCDRATAS